jgi:hypothetical protein
LDRIENYFRATDCRRRSLSGNLVPGGVLVLLDAAAFRVYLGAPSAPVA